MIIPTFGPLNPGDAIVPGLFAQESAALIVLAVTLVVYRTFRERYLLVWIAGWLLHLAAGWSVRAGSARSVPWLVALAPAEFVLTLGLFSVAVLLYTQNRRLLWPLVLFSSAVAGYGAMQVLCWPESVVLGTVFYLLCRLIALTAGLELIRYRWARPETGPWLLAISLFLLHPEWSSGSPHLVSGDGGIDLLLGTSMLLLVLDESKMRTRRLSVIQTLTNSMTRSLQPGPMLETALTELKSLMGAQAAWFRLLEADKMVIVQQIGLSRDFLRDRTSVPRDDSFERGFQDGKPVALKISSTDESARSQLRKEGFDHCVVIPVLGKKSIIGTLTLGSKRHLHYAPEEMEFLATTAHQLGLAVENLRLLEQILRSHRQWTNTFDSIQDAVLLHDSEFRIMKANMALLRRLGRAPAEIIGSKCETSLPRGVEWVGCPYCRDGKTFYEGADPCFGGFSMVSTSSYREQGSELRGTIHVVRDVTDRRVAEEKYRLLFEQMQEGVFVATPDGGLQECNDAFVRMLGYGSRDEVMTLNLDREVYVSPERRAEFRREVEAHNFVRNFEVLLRRRDGTVLSGMESSFATRDGEGKIERYQGFLLDVTEKKQAEDEIRRRNRELNALNAMAMIANQSFDLDEILNLTLRQMILLLDARAGSIYVADLADGKFRRRADWGRSGVEKRRENIVELPEGFGELVTRSRTEVLTAEYLPHLPAAVAQFISNGQAETWIWVLLWGREYPLGLMGIQRDQTQKVSSSDENLLVATSRQLATTIEKVRLYEETSRAYEDLRRTQEQLLQSEKMSAVGQLISGVAHELNNPLTAILGYAQLLEAEGLSSRAADFVAKLFRQAQRTHRVVQNLLSFARQRKPQRYRVDVRKVLEETLVLREYDLKANGITVEREVEPELPGVIADPHQLEQVFLNIINNALDAMLERGKGGLLRVCVYTDGSKVHAEFQDSGPGIKEPNRVFDPFYTTKSVGKGTGLGLSICYGIIKEHGGDISAHNRQEGGASIEIRLPAAGQGVVPEQVLSPARHELAIEGRVLLVEDEEAVLEFGRDVLSGAGAKVVTCVNAGDAQAKLLAEAFDALIINGKMPGGWSPREVYRWLGEKTPDMRKRVLFTFSAMPESDVRTFLHEHHIPFLVKPFEVAELISQARGLLPKTQAAVVGSA